MKEAVRKAQRAGVTVRMVTGDNIATAKAIARQCGIYTENGIAVEGPNFRAMTPAQVDEILPRLQVMGRSSPDDKYLLVTRLNGNGLPETEEDWLKKHADKHGYTFSWTYLLYEISVCVWLDSCFKKQSNRSITSHQLTSCFKFV